MKKITNSKQRAYLRSLAANTDTYFQVGKGGVSGTMTASISDALEAHELVKIKMLETCMDEKDAVAQAIADATDSEVVCIIGNRIVLYRESEKHKKIDLSPFAK